MTELLKRQAAEAAMKEIKSGQNIGLGTGSTASHFVDLLGAAVADGFECICVATSKATAKQARDLGITLVKLDNVDGLDIVVDGTDEIDPQLNLIKGGGGALLHEKIVAGAAARMIVISDGSKLVDDLGAFPLPIEVNHFGMGTTRRRLEKIMEEHSAQGALTMRAGADGEPFVTDGGHMIFDACFGRISDAKALSSALLGVPGVVQHGLFLDMCDIAFVASADGVTRLERR